MFDVKVVTPGGIKSQCQAEYVQYETVEGGMGVLTNRLPIIAKLKVCPVTIRKTDKTEEKLIVHGGIVDMSGKELIILTTKAERFEEIDALKTKEMIDKLEKEVTTATQDREKIKNEIETNRIRYKYAQTVKK
jgi:F-type H+-transporting ATPase subunit epsilon